MNLFSSEYTIDTEFNINSKVIIKQADVLLECKKIPDSTFKMIVSSPPYNVGKSYENKLNFKDYLLWQENIISELVRICNNTGSIVWQIGNFVNEGEVFPLDIYFYNIFKKFNMKLRNRIIWHFNHGLHASKRLSGRYETLLWFTKTDDYTFNLDDIRVPSKYPGKRHYKGDKKGLPSGNKLGKNPSDFWELMSNEFENGIIDIPNVKSNHIEKTMHPCQFPVELVERCILAFTNENDFVLDPFGGVGSTLIASIKRNRRCMIIDKDHSYLEIAQNRVAKYYDCELKTREIGTPIHVPTGKESVSKIPEEWLN